VAIAPHSTFTASGMVTTRAARLAAAAGDGEILAGPETVQRLGGRYRLERVGSVHLKNLTEALEVHRIVSPPTRHDRRRLADHGDGAICTASKTDCLSGVALAWRPARAMRSRRTASCFVRADCRSGPWPHAPRRYPTRPKHAW